MAAVELPSPAPAFVQRFVFVRDRFFRERYENLAIGVGLAVGFAVLTGFSAQVAIYTPWSPVPITLQVLAALLSGVVLGYRWGTLAQVLYVVLGAFLVPWYAPAAGHGAFSTGGLAGHGLGGVAVITGANAGYILAFPVAAFLIGWFSDRYPRARGPLPEISVMMLGVAVIYTFGATGVWLAYRLPFDVLMQEAVLLFIPLDIAKAFVAGVVGTALTPKVPFGPESPKAGGFRRWWPVAR